MGFYERLDGDGVVHFRLVDDGSFMGDSVDGDGGVDASLIYGWKGANFFLSMVIGENGISRTLFFDDRLDDVVDVMMDVFVYDRPFIHDNALFVRAFLFFFFVGEEI